MWIKVQNIAKQMYPQWEFLSEKEKLRNCS